MPDTTINNNPCWTIFLPAWKETFFLLKTLLFGLGLFFLYVLTAEKILVINDSRTQHKECGGVAPTLQGHFSCSQDFRCSLYASLIFYLFRSRPLMLMQMQESGEQAAFLEFQECSVKCIVFVSKELSSVLRPSLFSTLLIVRRTFEAMGNPRACFFFFTKKTRGHTQWQMMQMLGPQNI